MNRSLYGLPSRLRDISQGKEDTPDREDYQEGHTYTLKAQSGLGEHDVQAPVKFVYDNGMTYVYLEWMIGFELGLATFMLSQFYNNTTEVEEVQGQLEDGTWETLPTEEYDTGCFLNIFEQCSPYGSYDLWTFATYPYDGIEPRIQYKAYRVRISDLDTPPTATQYVISHGIRVRAYKESNAVISKLPIGRNWAMWLATRTNPDYVYGDQGSDYGFNVPRIYPIGDVTATSTQRTGWDGTYFNNVYTSAVHSGVGLVHYQSSCGKPIAMDRRDLIPFEDHAQIICLMYNNFEVFWFADYPDRYWATAKNYLSVRTNAITGYGISDGNILGDGYAGQVTPIWNQDRWTVHDYTGNGTSHYIPLTFEPVLIFIIRLGEIGEDGQCGAYAKLIQGGDFWKEMKNTSQIQTSYDGSGITFTSDTDSTNEVGASYRMILAG